MGIPLRTAVETRRLALLARVPFFGILLGYLRLVEQPAAWFAERGLCATACTDGERIVYCREWFEELLRTDPEMILTVLAHEALHPALSHLWRRETRDPLLWNVSADAVCNDILERNGFRLSSDFIRRRPEWKDLPEEVIYERLKRNAIPITITFALQGDMLEPGATGDQTGAGDGNGKDPGAKTVGGAAQDGADAAQRAQDLWRRRLVRAYHAAKSQGHTPAGVGELIDELLYPTQDWRVLLARFIQPTLFDYDWLRPDRRLLGAYDLYVPTLAGERLEDVVCYVDTSSSMSGAEIRACLSEVRGILQAFPQVRAHLVTGDAQVWQWQELTEQDPVPREIKGRGGTDFRPVFDEIHRRGITPTALTMFTDGMGTYPETTPSYPVLWVLTRNHEKPPFGAITVLVDIKTSA
jgi:predicted metal-dependent peptidase